MAPPPQWGVPELVKERLGSGVKDITFERGTVTWPMLSSGHLWELFRTTYGPFVVALGKLKDQPEKQQELATKVQAVFESFFAENVVTFDYLVTRATKI